MILWVYNIFMNGKGAEQKIICGTFAFFYFDFEGSDFL